jgi:hypothetical protein
MVKYLSFHNSFFCLKLLLKCKWQGHSVTHPLLVKSLEKKSYKSMWTDTQFHLIVPQFFSLYKLYTQIGDEKGDFRGQTKAPRWGAFMCNFDARMLEQLCCWLVGFKCFGSGCDIPPCASTICCWNKLTSEGAWQLVKDGLCHNHWGAMGLGYSK